MLYTSTEKEGREQEAAAPHPFFASSHDGRNKHTASSVRRVCCGTQPDMLLVGSLLALAAPSLQDAEASRGTLSQLSDGGLKFELFLPTKWRHPAASASRWPILVFLHGAGESGGFEVTNAQSLPWLLVAGNNASFAASCGFIVLVPQCPQVWR